ncbi:succinate dehydrogenase, cytochrome b556 subunit [Sphingomonas sp. ASV193]|uniref:succinate dehydrogenase, cytochrome b556 subunit n=1 Tax=Sphingomonas sp. ASV193 TaxID=3144405 RepID=UPI0032E8B165
MPAPSSRPLSPHLTIWRWGPHMLISILHRVTGGALTVAGLAVLSWFLLALSGSASGFDTFAHAAQSVPGTIVLVGLTWAFWQHLLSGLRHVVLDIGAGYALPTNRFFSVLILFAAPFLTALTWALLEGMIK